MSQALDYWKDLSAALYHDGSLRDIYVLGADLEDWISVARFIAGSGNRYRFSGSWTGPDFPDDITHLFATEPESEMTMLAIDVTGVQVNCHFFAMDEIEFDVAPWTVTDASKLGAIVAFVQGLARAVGKDAIFTPENESHAPLFRCRPDSDRIIIYPNSHERRPDENDR